MAEVPRYPHDGTFEPRNDIVHALLTAAANMKADKSEQNDR
jgi:hypothetical protein